MNTSSPVNGTPPWWRTAWLHGYNRGLALQDLVAGLVVAVLVVPQSLAYAMLAGLPPHVGMYASILPLLAYAWLGSSMTLAVGPVAVAALMTASALAPLASAGTAQYTEMAVLLALLGGVFLLVFGFLRMGFLANLLSHPVVSGFVTGSALLIAIGQLKPLLGIPMKGHSAFELAASALTHITQFHGFTAVIGLSAMALLWLARRFAARALQALGLSAPRADLMAKLTPMLVVLLSVLAVVTLNLDTERGVAVVGVIPSGLPQLQWRWPTMEQFRLLAAPAAMIALVGFVESVSVAQSLAIKRGERINPDRELRGLGLANVASAISGGFPVTGGFSRSVVSFAAGARTPLTGVVAAVLMAFVLLGLTGLFERLPLAVLGATIIVAVLGLVDTTTLRHAWRYDRADALAFAGTVLGVLGLGVEAGIAIGVGLSVGMFLWRASRPHVAVLGRLPGTEHFRNELRYQVQTWPGMLLLRIDENLFFANITAVVDRIGAELQRRPDTRCLILAMTSVSHVDLSALEAMERLTLELARQGISLHLAEVKGPVLDRLAHSDWLALLPQPPFVSVNAAVQALAPTET